MGAHAAVAVELGIPREIMNAILADISSAGIEEKLRVIFQFIGKLTLTPHDISQADADKVFAAGWDERALHDAIEVCALFNYMNRLVDGHGLQAEAASFQREGSMLKDGYTPIIDVLGLK